MLVYCWWVSAVYEQSGYLTTCSRQRNRAFVTEEGRGDQFVWNQKDWANLETIYRDRHFFAHNVGSRATCKCEGVGCRIHSQGGMRGKAVTRLHKEFIDGGPSLVRSQTNLHRMISKAKQQRDECCGRRILLFFKGCSFAFWLIKWGLHCAAPRRLPLCDQAQVRPPFAGSTTWLDRVTLEKSFPSMPNYLVIVWKLCFRWSCKHKFVCLPWNSI